jgi:hypothetical protein
MPDSERAEPRSISVVAAYERGRWWVRVSGREEWWVLKERDASRPVTLELFLRVMADAGWKMVDDARSPSSNGHLQRTLTLQQVGNA